MRASLCDRCIGVCHVGPYTVSKKVGPHDLNATSLKLTSVNEFRMSSTGHGIHRLIVQPHLTPISMNSMSIARFDLQIVMKLPLFQTFAIQKFFICGITCEMNLSLCDASIMMSISSSHGMSFPSRTAPNAVPSERIIGMF